jgi:hypothetical protein
MSARFGMTQEGKPSEHCLDNTGPRRFFVVEQDNGGPHQQVSVLSYLAQFLNLVLVVYSGSRSTHGWFCRRTSRGRPPSVHESRMPPGRMPLDPDQVTIRQIARRNS